MRSYRWRSQATRAGAPAAPRAALRDSAIRIATRSAPAALSRPALLGSGWARAPAITTPNPARANDTTWTGQLPNPQEWTQDTNWNPVGVPNGNDRAIFTNNSAATSVTISNSTSIDTIHFTTLAPAYSFTVQNGAVFT